MVKINLKDILNAKPTIEKLLGEPLPAIMAYELRKFFKIIEEEFDNFNKIKNDKIIEYGEKKEDGTYFIDKDNKNYQKFIDEINELLDKEIEINSPKLNIENLKDTKLSVFDIDSLIKINVIKE